MSALAFPQGRSAQQPERPPLGQRLEAQARAQLEGLALHKRQLEEQAEEQIHDLEQQAGEQITQLQADTKRQIDLAMSQMRRQIDQLRRQAKRQAELLDAQMKVVEAQAGIRSEATRPLTRSDRASSRALALERGEGKAQLAISAGVAEKLDKILDRLERLEKRLERLENRRGSPLGRE